MKPKDISGSPCGAGARSSAAGACRRAIESPHFSLAWEQLESVKDALRKAGHVEILNTLEWAEGTLSHALDELAESAEGRAPGLRAPHSSADSLLRWVEVPDRAGWWWFLFDELKETQPEVVQVREDRDRLVYKRIRTPDFIRVAKPVLGRWFFGPITLPELPVERSTKPLTNGPDKRVGVSDETRNA